MNENTDRLELAVREHEDFYSLFDQLNKYEGQEGQLVAQHLAVAMFVKAVLDEQGVCYEQRSYAFEYTWPDVMQVTDNILTHYTKQGKQLYLTSKGE